MWAEQAPTSVADSPQGMPLPWPLQLPWALVRSTAIHWWFLHVGPVLCASALPAFLASCLGVVVGVIMFLLCDAGPCVCVRALLSCCV